MKPRVVWNGVPSEHKAAFQPYIKRYLPSLPCWVKTLTISYNTAPQDEGETVFLAVGAQEEMREVEMHYQPAWLECDDESREEKVSHEFAHVPFLPAAEIAEAVMRESNAPKALRDQWERRVEAATQDMAEVLRKAYGAG